MTKLTIDSCQRESAESAVSSRQLVLAGPGTGKTQTVAMRLAYLLGSGVGPAQILVLSFSRSAVKTLTKRLEIFASNQPIALNELKHISIRTFDSWAFRLLRQLGFLPRDLLSGSHDSNISRLVQEIKVGRRDEILSLLGNLKHIIVDEFQDLAGIRGELVLELLKLLSPPDDDGIGFTVLGDEAQAIYGFSLHNPAGDPLVGPSTAELLEKLRIIYAGKLQTVELLTNHRAAPNLASVYSGLRKILARDVGGEKKLNAMRLFLRRIPELATGLSATDILGLSDDTAAILTRTNGEAIRIYQKLIGDKDYPSSSQISLKVASRNHHIPAWIGATLNRYQGKTLTYSQFKKIYQYLYPEDKPQMRQQSNVPAEDDAWMQLVLATEASSGALSINLDELKSRMSWADFLSDEDTASAGAVQIMTVHQSKGMEFGSVTVLDHEDDEERDSEMSSSSAVEEASVIFVALTRAGKILKRIPVGEKIYPLSIMKFNGGYRRRWGSWRNSWFNLEMGLPGDVISTSFVDLRVHESEENISALQNFLAENVLELKGRKVVLCIKQLPGSERKLVYEIRLQEDEKPGRLLGMTSEQLTTDLLSKLWKSGYSLPSIIRNLRIMDVVTLGLVGDAESGMAECWAASGFWLGVDIYGTGDFKTYRRKLNGTAGSQSRSN